MVSKQRRQFCKIFQKCKQPQPNAEIQNYTQAIIQRLPSSSSYRRKCVFPSQILSLKSLWAWFILPEQFFTPSTVWRSLSWSLFVHGGKMSAVLHVRLQGCCILQSHCQWCPSPREGSRRLTDHLRWGSPAKPSLLQITGCEVGPDCPPLKHDELLGAEAAAVIHAQLLLNHSRPALPCPLQRTQIFLCLATCLPPQTPLLPTGSQCGWRCVQSGRCCCLSRRPGRAKVSCPRPAARGRGGRFVSPPCSPCSFVSRCSAGLRRARSSSELVGWWLRNCTLWIQGSPTPAEGDKEQSVIRAWTPQLFSGLLPWNVHIALTHGWTVNCCNCSALYIQRSEAPTSTDLFVDAKATTSWNAEARRHLWLILYLPNKGRQAPPQGWGVTEVLRVARVSVIMEILLT